MLNDEDTCNEIQMKRNLRELIQAAQKENELQKFICSFGRMDVYFTVMMLFNQHQFISIRIRQELKARYITNISNQ